MPVYFTRYVELDDISIRSAAKGGDGRTVEAYVTPFMSPTPIDDQQGRYREQIAPDAFVRTLVEEAGRIGVFYNHASTIHGFPSERFSMPLGTPLELRPDGRGLFSVTRYNTGPLADEVLAAIDNGDIKGQSFSGRMVKSNPAPPPGGKYRPSRSGELPLVTRTQIQLREYGPTPFPAYTSGAEILEVRAAWGALMLGAGLDSAPYRAAGSTSSEPESAVATLSGAGKEEAGEPSERHSARSVGQLRARLRAARISRGLESGNGDPFGADPQQAV
jgi:HK97 family phage prohead protease